MSLRLNFKSSLTLTILLWFSFSAFSQVEKVEQFHADIEIETSGDIIITETIDIYAAGNVFKRGVVRNLPVTVTQDEYGRNKKVSYDVISVKKDGNRSKYHIEKEDSFFNIYVGEKSVFLNRGEYEYEIKYRVTNQIGFFDDYDEVYWNVNGFDWSVPIDKISATVKIPNSAKSIQNACYTGRRGSRVQDCDINVIDNKINFSFTNPNVGENLTVSSGFTKGIVNEPPPAKPPTFFEMHGIKILTGLFALILFPYYFITWRKFGIDPPKPTVYPQFETPEGLSPASMGMVRKGRFWNDLLSASIINLAIKGYLKINEVEKKYVFGLFKDNIFEITKIQDGDSSLPKEESLILKQFFGKGNMKVLDGKYDASVESVVKMYEANVYGQWRKLLNQGNNLKFIIFPIMFTIIYVLSFFVLLAYVLVENSLLYFLGFVLLNAIFFLLYVWLIRKPAEEKLRLRSEIDGFKMYLGAAEEKQLQQFNPPKLTPEVFEKYLPYAIVLDVDDIWGEKFQNLLTKMGTEQYQSTWSNYSGGNFGNFTHTLNSSLSNTLAHSATQPSSSSGGGSGGGGFSGGGGGGGGGGGW